MLKFNQEEEEYEQELINNVLFWFNHKTVRKICIKVKSNPDLICIFMRNVNLLAF
jgi:hypothetical protein